MQKLAVEITSDGIIDEPFWCLGLSTSLVLEYNIIIPPVKDTYKEQDYGHHKARQHS
jgi:hypothetical protein